MSAPKTTPATFTCAACGETFEKAWPDDKAAAELEARFPGFDPADCETICHDCDRLIAARAGDNGFMFGVRPKAEQMKVTHFGQDPNSWNVGERGDDFEFDGDGSGMPGVSLMANAVSVWVNLQDRPVAVEETALAFCLTPDLIREAVNYHYWMCLTHDGKIEHDGE